ncbi:MAG: tetrahydromethanopterin S-methyltransferase subunit F [Euryarchaeota archaeon]|nr:tetrahydromethanopterin S-methyltransferase subunit F [Euryarchaeota archaeon]
MSEKIPGIGNPDSRELDRMVAETERRVMMIGRDQRVFSGVNNLAARSWFVIGFLTAAALVFMAYLLR